MALKAFDLLPVTKHVAFQIYSIEASGNDLYLGCDESLILHLAVEERTDPTNEQIVYSSNIICQKNVGTKKPVVLMKTASALGRLLALSDGNLFILDADVLSTVGAGPKIKNILVFCVNENPSMSDPFTLQFCVGKKKCLQICSLHEERVSLLQEISTQDPPVNMAMDGSYVCVAGHSQYYIYNVESGQAQDLFPCDTSISFPHIKRISKEEFLVMAPGNLGMFVTSAGTSERPPIHWGEGILALSYYHPYILTITSSFIRIYSLIDQQHKQTILFSGSFLMGNFDGQLYIATENSVHCLMPQPWTSQVMTLLENESTDEAIELMEHSGGAGTTPEKFSAFSQRVFQRSGFIELSHGNYSKAQDHFISGKLDIRELLSLYPGLLPVKTDFLRAQPPLHSLVDINQASHGDKEKITAATSFLLSYLIFVRGCPEIAVHRLELDTALIKLYADKNSEDLLIFLENDDITCAAKECTELLREKKHFAALAKLYMKFGQREQSLDILTKLVRGELHDERFQGVSHLVDVILSSSDENLLWKYTDFVFNVDETEGLRMICDFEADIDYKKVLKCLLQYPASRVNYLNHLIYIKKLEDESVHTELVLYYISELLKNKENENLLYRTKLRDILTTSEKYNPKVVLARLHDTHLLFEMATVYGKMNQHQKALSVLVYDLKDFEAAESYCIQRMKTLPLEQRSYLFTTLLRIYLKPPPRSSPDAIELPAALDLLTMHSSELDLNEVLEILPSDWSVTIVGQYLKGAIRANMNQSRMKKLQLNLMKSFDLHKKYLSQKMCTDVGAIRLTANSICCVCEKSFKTSDFTLYPNGVLTHPSCAKYPDVCPLTGTIFRLKNVLET